MEQLIRGKAYSIGFKASEELSANMFIMVIIYNANREVLYKASTRDGSIESIGNNMYISQLTSFATSKMVGNCVLESKLYNENEENIPARNKIQLQFLDNVIHCEL